MGDTIAAALRLAAIIEWSDDAIVAKDLNGIITSWNRGAERVFGYTAEEAIGHSILLIVPPERHSEEEEVLRRIRRGEAVDHFETVRRRKDGTLVAISLTISPIRDASGAVVGASKIARDISERRRIEAALARIEAEHTDLRQRLSALVAGSGTLLESPKVGDVLDRLVTLAGQLVGADAYALWRHDPDAALWRIVSAQGLSAAFVAQTVPVSSSARVPTAFGEPLAVADLAERAELRERLPAYMSEGVRGLLAVPVRVRQTVSVMVACYYREPHPFTEVERHIARALGNLAGAAITTAELYEDQQRSRERAERENRRTSFLAEVSSTLANSLDYRRNLEAMAALAVPDVADSCAIDLAGDTGALERLVLAGSSAAVDPSAGGDRIAVPLVAHGRTLGVLAVAMRESGRHYKEEDRRLLSDLAYRAAQAVDIARAYEQVSAANRAKDEFLATLSHELRTPLNAVLGWTQMLRAGSVRPERIDHALDAIERNAAVQLRLIEDLLDLSRVVTGKFKLQVDRLNLADAIRAAVESVQPAATAKGIELDVSIDPAAGDVLGDAARLQQTVWNLLSNAIKFTPDGGHVAVRLERAGSHAQIEVRDTGAGISPEVLPFVFDRFRQGHSGANGYGGLGLGLAIVRHIVELHGGTVEALSEGIGCGASFRIRLPLAGVSTGAGRVAPHAASA